MINVRSLAFATFLVTSVLGGCAAQPADAPAQDGLTLTTNTANLVSGSVRRDGVGLMFESAADGDKMHVVLQATDGVEILRMTSEGGKTTTSILDARFVIEVPRAGAPVINGDPKVVDELKARPDFALAQDLSKLLAEAGVDPALTDPMVGPKRAPLTAEVPSDEGGSGGGARAGCGLLQKIGCAAFITTCSGTCAVATAGTGLAVCIAACVASTVAGCERCL